MGHDHHRGRLVWGLLLATLLMAGLAMSARAQSDCRVEVVEGWHTGAGTATIIMRNGGSPCGGTLYTVPKQKVAVDKMIVVVPPKNGVVVVAVPRFAYTPNAGFVGEDRFELSAEGPGRAKGNRLTLSGVVLVRVEP